MTVRDGAGTREGLSTAPRYILLLYRPIFNFRLHLSRGYSRAFLARGCCAYISTRNLVMLRTHCQSHSRRRIHNTINNKMPIALHKAKALRFWIYS